MSSRLVKSESPSYDDPSMDYLAVIRDVKRRRNSSLTLLSRIKSAMVVGAAYGVIFFLLAFQISKNIERSLIYTLLSFIIYAALAFLISSRK